MSDKRFARDVAKEMDRRQRGRRLGLLALLGAAAAAAAMYLRCGDGWGLGGSGAGGAGDDKGDGSAVISAPSRCVVRVSADGITVDGKPMKRGEAVTACEKTDGALVTVTGDARQGDWDDLRLALEQAKVKIYKRGE